MSKKRTGLQSEIAGIFSGVPVPKKGGSRSQPGGPAPKPGGPAPKPGDPASKPGGSVISKPAAPVTPKPQKPVEPLPATARPKVTEVKAPEKKTRQIPPKISRRRKDKLFATKAGVSSSRQKTGIIIFVLLSIALFFVLARPYLPSSGNQPPSQPGGKENNGNLTRADIKIEWPMPKVYPEKFRDPMVLVSRQQNIRIETSDGFAVRGISYSDDRRFAVIGTETMQEGDIIQGATIVEINPNNVVFEKDGKRWTQEVQGEE